jgi:hypothetical protein
LFTVSVVVHFRFQFRNNANTWYGRLTIPSPTRSLTLQEAPSFPWRTDGGLFIPQRTILGYQKMMTDLYNEGLPDRQCVWFEKGARMVGRRKGAR